MTMWGGDPVVRQTCADIWDALAARRLLEGDMRGYTRALTSADIFHEPVRFLPAEFDPWRYPALTSQ